MRSLLEGTFAIIIVVVKPVKMKELHSCEFLRSSINTRIALKKKKKVHGGPRCETYFTSMIRRVIRPSRNSNKMPGHSRERAIIHNEFGHMWPSLNYVIYP